MHRTRVCSCELLRHAFRLLLYQAFSSFQHVYERTSLNDGDRAGIVNGGGVISNGAILIVVWGNVNGIVDVDVAVEEIWIWSVFEENDF